ncbi:hypothetical protein N9C83_03970 [Opitutales bacterium]|nr:hypothetical protein [Opitutales bacterium]
MKTILNAIKKFNWIDISLSFLALLAMFPNPYHTVAELDATWQAVLEFGLFNNWQFGKDIIFTGGPLSFLYGPTSIGYIPKLQVLLEASLLFATIFVVQLAVRKEHIVIRILTFAVLACGAATSRDGVYLISATAIAFLALQNSISKPKLLACVSLAACLGLMKFTIGMLGFTSLLVVVGLKLWDRKTSEALQILGTYLGTVIILWMVIGQSILNLPAYIYHSWSLSQGYAWGMHLHEPGGIFKFLMLILLSSSIPIFIWTLIRKDRKAWAILLVAALGMFVSWKTGITRYGTHVFYFIQVAILIPVLVLTFIENKRNGYLWIACCSVLFFWSNFWLLPTNANKVIQRATAQGTFGLKFVISAGNEVKKFSDLVPYVKMSHTLHQIKERIGEETVDVLYYHHGILLLNELNYVPRPTIQNYAAYNEHLTQWNLQHLRDTPPQFILCKDGEIDARYPTTADNLFLREVFENYSPVLKEEDWLLLERNNEPTPFTDITIIDDKKIIMGEEVDLSDHTNKALWLKIGYNPSLLHKAASFLYKPEILIIKITTPSNETKHYRLIGQNLKHGFLLNPTLNSIKSMESFLKTGQLDEKVSQFSIHSDAGMNPFPTKEISIELLELSTHQ